MQRTKGGDRRSSRVRQQVLQLKTQIEAPQAFSKTQVAEALEALQDSLAELEAVEAERARQNDELTRVREELEVERHRFRELFELAPVGYLVTDVKGVVVEANPAAGAMLRCSVRSLLRKPLTVLMSNPERVTLWQLLKGLEADGGLRETELLFDGRPDLSRHILVTVQRDEDRPGRPQRLRWVMRDVTEHRETEEALRTSEDRLRHSQKLEAVGQLAGGIAHSFNNLLAAIALHTELLMEVGDSDPARRRHTEEIQRASERGSALARQLLAFSRKQILQPEPLDVGHHLETMLPMLRRLLGETVEIELRVDPGTGWIHGDLGQLEQVILNLVVNARDAMPDGGALTLAVKRVRAEEHDLDPAVEEYVEICVSDTGSGMDPEVRTRVFEPFFTTKARGQGTGLGLATVYGIVSQSGGDIRLKSEPGAGTTFHLYLPGIPVPAPGAEAAPPATLEAGGTQVLLLVEDEENIREPAKEILEARGYTVLAARDGTEALAMSRRWEGAVDMLVTDVIMPRMNGSQLADEILRDRPDLAVLYISGYPEDAIARHGVLHHPGRSFLQKPFAPGALLRKVKETLERNR